MFGYLERIMREDTVFKALTIEDTDSLAGLFGAVRFCYNKALYLKTHFYKVKGGECQDFCVWGGYSRGSPTRLPFVFCDAVCQT